MYLVSGGWISYTLSVEHIVGWKTCITLPLCSANSDPLPTMSRSLEIRYRALLAYSRSGTVEPVNKATNFPLFYLKYVIPALTLWYQIYTFMAVRGRNCYSVVFSTTLPRSKHCSAELPLRVGLIMYYVNSSGIHAATQCVWAPPLNGNSALQCFERDNLVQICNRIIPYNSKICLQWNPSITDTLGTQNFVHYNEVSLSQGLPVYFR